MRLPAALRRLFGRSRAVPEDDWEGLAAEFLRGKGFEIAARNVRMRLGELDIVAVDRGEIVFVEVKARKSREFGGPEYAIVAKKKTRLLRAAKEFIAREGISERPCRFDAVFVYTGGAKPEFEHIVNAFEDSVQ
jgi:putative endonuclease